MIVRACYAVLKMASTASPDKRAGTRRDQGKLPGKARQASDGFQLRVGGYQPLDALALESNL